MKPSLSKTKFNFVGQVHSVDHRGVSHYQNVSLELDAKTFGQVKDLDDLREQLLEVSDERIECEPVFEDNDVVTFFNMLDSAGMVRA